MNKRSTDDYRFEWLVATGAHLTLQGKGYNVVLRFNDWFFWPGVGNYCWPCYHATGKIYTRRERIEQ